MYLHNSSCFYCYLENDCFAQVMAHNFQHSLLSASVSGLLVLLLLSKTQVGNEWKVRALEKSFNCLINTNFKKLLTSLQELPANHRMEELRKSAADPSLSAIEKEKKGERDRVEEEQEKRLHSLLSTPLVDNIQLTSTHATT